MPLPLKVSVGVDGFIFEKRWPEKCEASIDLRLVLLKLAMFEVVIILFFVAEASDAFLSELFPEASGILVINFAALLQERNNLFSLFFAIATPDEVYDIWQIIVKALRGGSLLCIFLASSHRV